MTIFAYENSSGAIVIPDCPDSGGEHSHFLIIEDDAPNYEQAEINENGDGTYICPFGDSSGEEIPFQLH